MAKNSQDLSAEDIRRMAQSPQAKQLISLLRRTDDARLQQAIREASGGDYAKASETLNALLSSSEAKKLLDDLKG